MTKNYNDILPDLMHVVLIYKITLHYENVSNILKCTVISIKFIPIACSAFLGKKLVLEI